MKDFLIGAELGMRIALYFWAIVLIVKEISTIC